jgi:formylglycine-generating enzyme required for sulfatase activity
MLIAAALLVTCVRMNPEKQWNNPFDPDGGNWHPPRVMIPSPEVVAAINDTIILQVRGVDNDETIARFNWSLDHGSSWRPGTGPHGELNYAWGADEVGRQIVWVKAVDAEGVSSLPDSFTVMVHRYTPVVLKISDTTVSQRATVRLTIAAADTNGTIAKYLWRTDSAAGCTDSTTVPQRDFSLPQGGPLQVIYAARDDDGLIIRDSCRGPQAAVMTQPIDKDTAAFSAYNYIDEKGSIPFRFQGSDPDGNADTLFYALMLGTDPVSLNRVFAGRDTQWTALDILPSSRYYWKLRVRDHFGDSIETAGVFYTNPPPKTPTNMVLIRAAGAQFPMGVARGESYEQPVHPVSFSHYYWIGVTEVTQQEFRSLMGGTVATGLGGSLPITQINWFDAALYCNARSKLEKRDTVYTYRSLSGTPGANCTLTDLHQNTAALGYALPTEAQWEYACRAASITPYYWGDNMIAIDANAWYRDNSGATVHPVAGKKSNEFGLYDICGNVWEWCNDWFDPGYYAISPAKDPLGPMEGTERVVRGGSWANSDYFCASGVRSKLPPSFSGNAVGFRVVLPHP